jgi:hypothetical protein
MLPTVVDPCLFSHCDQVRALCRRQFLVRVVCSKVAALMQEHQEKAPYPRLTGITAPQG